MKQIRQQSPTRSRRLLGLTSLAFLILFFLNEGQARTLSSLSPIQSIKVQSTPYTEMASKICRLESNRVPQSTKCPHRPEVGTQKMDNHVKPPKKNFGFALLFVKTLAEKS